MTEQTRLDALLLRYEELRAQGTSASPEELCLECPELLEELKRQIRALDSMNALLVEAASEEVSAAAKCAPADPDVSGAELGEALSTGSRYQVLRFHAKGGLGEVHV